MTNPGLSFEFEKVKGRTVTYVPGDRGSRAVFREDGQFIDQVDFTARNPLTEDFQTAAKAWKENHGPLPTPVLVAC
jgi:hypothetical protein